MTELPRTSPLLDSRQGFTFLSPNFAITEFIKPNSGYPPADCWPLIKNFCQEILEAIRKNFNCQIKINSGYRSPSHNAAIGGVHGSFHIWTSAYCAVDFVPLGVDLIECFEWLRLNSNLNFDKVILERSWIHIQYREEHNRHEAYVARDNGNVTTYDKVVCIHNGVRES